MTPLLRAELLKLRTTRTFVALASIAVILSVAFTTLGALLSEPTEENVLTEVFNSDTSSLFILVLALVGITGEWRHRTITSAVLAAPHRVRFLAAKTLAYAAAGVCLSLLISVSVAIVGFILLTARDLPVPEAGELAGLWLRNAAVAALLGAFGVGVGALVRNQVAAIVGVLLFMFAVEPTVLALAPDVGRFGPLIALPSSVSGNDAGLEDVDLLASGLATLAMFGWIAVAFGLGAALLRRRDLT